MTSPLAVIVVAMAAMELRNLRRNNLNNSVSECI